MSNIKTSQHDKEHRNWSRRQFLFTGGLGTLGGLVLGGTGVSAASPSKLMAALNTTNTDRVIVLIYMFGGNDSLNMIIPHSSEAGLDAYLGLRPHLAQQHGPNYDDNHLLSNFGDTNFALPSTMNPLLNLWHTNEMHVIHKVGYANANLSHFASRDQWFAGADDRSDNRFKSGWMGRYLEQLYPAFLEAPSATPPAIKIGASGNSIFKNSDSKNMELVFKNPTEFYNRVNREIVYEVDGLGDCPQGTQLAFLRGVANNSVVYSETTFNAYNNSEHMPTVTYSNALTNGSSTLQSQLKIVSRLIKGGLGTKIYMVRIGGFDTHGDQPIVHPNLLTDVANAISDFQADLAATGDDERVITFPFSEFGRTLRENGGVGNARGTEHGTLADLMLFGKGVNGGFSGTPLNLSHPSLTSGGWRVDFEDAEAPIDYRSIYATLLQDWLCMDPIVVDYALGQYYPRLPNLIADPCTTNRAEQPEVLLGHRTSVDNATLTEIRYGVLQPGQVKIEVYNNAGQQLVTLVDKHHAQGTYTFELSAQTYPFPAGEYAYKMKTGGKEYVRKFSR